VRRRSGRPGAGSPDPQRFRTRRSSSSPHRRRALCLYAASPPCTTRNAARLGRLTVRPLWGCQRSGWSLRITARAYSRLIPNSRLRDRARWASPRNRAARGFCRGLPRSSKSRPGEQMRIGSSARRSKPSSQEVLDRAPVGAREPPKKYCEPRLSARTLRGGSTSTAVRRIRDNVVSIEHQFGRKNSIYVASP